MDSKVHLKPITHTLFSSGDWHFVPPNEDGETIIMADDDTAICEVSGGLGPVFEDARCYESEANARLLGSSPQLFAIVDWLSHATRSELPYEVSAYHLPDDVIEEARRLVKYISSS